MNITIFGQTIELEIKPGKCEVCSKELAPEEVWNRIHIGRDRRESLDLCKACSERGYHFWHGQVYAMPGTPSEQERVFGLRPVRSQRKRKSA